jgi:hypothetical protein
LRVAGLYHHMALFAQMSQHRGNRWPDLVDRCQQRIMRYVETVGPIVPLGRIANVDHGRGCDTSLRGDHRSDCCKTDHRRSVSRYGSSPNAAMAPALTKGKVPNSTTLLPECRRSAVNVPAEMLTSAPCAFNAPFNRFIQFPAIPCIELRRTVDAVIHRRAHGPSNSCRNRSEGWVRDANQRNGNDRPAKEKETGPRAGKNRCPRCDLQSDPGKISTRSRKILRDHHGNRPRWQAEQSRRRRVAPLSSHVLLTSSQAPSAHWRGFCLATSIGDSSGYPVWGFERNRPANVNGHGQEETRPADGYAACRAWRDSADPNASGYADGRKRSEDAGCQESTTHKN